MNTVRATVIAILLFLLTLPCVSQNIFTIGVSPFPPYIMGDETTPQGIFVDFFSQLKSRTDLDIQLLYLPSKRMYLSFVLHTVDAESFVDPAWRVEYTNISTYTIPIMETNIVLVMKTPNAIAVSSVEDFFGKTIGSDLGYYYAEGFQEAFDNESIIRDDSSTTDSVVLKLHLNRVDAIIIDPFVFSYVCQKLHLDPSEFTIVYTLKKASPMCLRVHTSQIQHIPELNKAIQSMISDGTVQSIIDTYVQ